MSIAARIKEERLRLGHSQTAFAELAGVTKSAQIKWESGTSSTPTAPALAAWAEAGADIIYVLTGRRSNDRSDEAVQADEQIAAIRRDMLVADWEPRDGEDELAAEARRMALFANQLRNLIGGRSGVGQLTAEQLKEAETLLSIIESPAARVGFRLADRVQNHARRSRLRERIRSHTDLGDYHPSEAAIDTMTTLALDHGAPIDLLSRLFYEIAVGDEPGWPEEGTEKAPA